MESKGIRLDSGRQYWTTLGASSLKGEYILSLNRLILPMLLFTLFSVPEKVTELVHAWPGGVGGRVGAKRGFTPLFGLISGHEQLSPV